MSKLIVISSDELSELIRTTIKEELQNKEDKRLLNFKQMKEFLGISASTLNKWKSTDKIPYKRLGKRIFFEKNEVIKALKDSNYSKLNRLI